jgi:hypothetical protein
MGLWGLVAEFGNLAEFVGLHGLKLLWLNLSTLAFSHPVELANGEDFNGADSARSLATPRTVVLLHVA